MYRNLQFYLCLALLMPCTTLLYAQTTVSYTYTGANQTFVVPVGVTSISVKMWGAGGAGAGGPSAGGSGALVKGTIAVTPGQVLALVVGGGGQRSTTAAIAGGFGGGGASGNKQGGSGGGYSGIFNTSVSFANALGIAGGGGGGGYYGNGTFGGAGGATSGSNGGDRTATTFQGGRGATAVAGGAAGAGTTVGTAGTALAGGVGGNNATYGGGGGGGGYYGGGGGYGSGSILNYSSGGGGGSSYLGTMTTTTNTAGVTNNANVATQAPGIAEVGYITGVGNGGNSAATTGGNGLITITFTCAPSTAPTAITGTNTVVSGSSTTLTSSGGTLGTDAIDVWYAGACATETYANNWLTNTFTVGNSTTTFNTNPTYGIMNITSTGADPSINMPTLGSFNPVTARYINIRYRVTAGTAGTAEIFFYNTAHAGATGGESAVGNLISDNAWHVLTIDMQTDPQYVSGGNITGWRYDWSSATGVTMDLDFITLTDVPMIDAASAITVSPTVNTTYYTAKKGGCLTTACASQAVTVTYITPTITSIPSAACVATSVVVTGTNLSGATAATINGVAATVTANTATSITLTVPAGAANTTGNIEITNGGGVATSTTTITINSLATAGSFQYANASTQSICTGNTISCTNTVAPTNGGAGVLSVVWYCGEELTPGSGTYGNWRESTLGNVSGTTSSANLNAAAGGGTGMATALTTYNPLSDFPTNTKFLFIRRAYTDLCGVCVSGCQDQSFYLVVNATPSITTNPANVSVAVGANATFTAVGNSTPASYSWEVSTNGGGAWNPVVNGAPYSGATTGSLLITAAPLAMNGYQYRAKAINGCGASAASTVATLTIGYCATSPTISGTGDIITKVSLTNSVAANYTNNSTYTAPAYYDIYNNTPLDLYTSSSNNTLAITVGTDLNQASAAWIDFNKNGIYEASENIALATALAGTSATITYTFAVPAGATLGNTRMRVRAGADVLTNYTAGGACTASPYGETEDYLVNITTLPYQATYTAMSTGAAQWCAGETRTVTVTITNSGLNAWTDVPGVDDFNIGVKWNADADYLVRVDALNLAAGANQTYSLTVTAPASVGNSGNNLTFNVVREGVAWFGGPYTSLPIGIKGLPTAVNAGADVAICAGTSTALSGSATGLSTTLFTEDFEAYTANSVITGTSSQWRESYISGAGNTFWAMQNCNLITGSRALGLYNNATSTYCSYQGTASLQDIAYNINPINASGYTALKLNFKWKCVGETFLGLKTDYFQVAYSTNKTNWTVLPTQYNAQSATQTVANLDLSVLNGQQFYIGFLWTNDGSTAGAAAAIDDISITGTAPAVTYAWTPSATLTSPTTTTPTATPTATQIYTMTATTNGCSASDAVEVTVNPLPTATATVSNATCNAGLGSATITAGLAGYQICTGAACTSFGASQISEVFGSLAANTYVVKVTDIKGCTKTTQFVVTEPTAITITGSSSTPPTCNGLTNGSITFSASGGTGVLEYSIDNGANYSATGSFTGIGAGSYTLIVRDANGCHSATQALNITAPAAVAFTYSTTNPTCFGGANGSITVTPSGGAGGYQFSYNNGGLFSTTNPKTGLSDGTYTVIVRDLNSCQSLSQNVVISAPAAITLTATPTQIVCNGGTGSVTLSSNGAAPLTYGGDAVTLLVANTYNYTVTDGNGCMANASATINAAPAAITLTATPTQIVCNGGTGSVTLSSNGAAPLTYGGGAVTLLVANTYNYTVTDGNGCMANVSATINAAPAAITLTAMPTQIACFGGTGSVLLSSNGATPLTYGGDATTLLVANTYNYTVTDGNGCTANASATINAAPTLLTAMATATDITCATPNATVTVTATGGTLTYNGVGAFPETTAGAKSYVVTDANGCSATANVTVMSSTAPPSFSITGLSALTCTATSITLTATGSGTGFAWAKLPSTTLGTAATETINTPGTYIVTATGGNGCTASATKLITQNQTTPSANIMGATSFCFGSSVNVLASPGFTSYEWSNGALVRNLTITAAGTYTVTITAANGCFTIKSTTIVMNTKPTLSLSSTPAITCTGSNFSIATTVTGTPLATTVSWLAGNGFSATTPVVSGVSTLTRTNVTSGMGGLHIARATNVCGTSSSSTNILVRNIIPATIAIQNASALGGSTGSAVVTAAAGSTYSWSTGETSNGIYNKAAGIYTVTVTPPMGSNYCALVRAIQIN
jgi:large repetitive protein